MLLLLVLALTLVPSPPHTRLFVAPALHDGRAEAFVVEASIEDAAAEYRQILQPPHRSSFRVEAVAPGEAFGGAAIYDRARVARLYGGRRARLARGPVIRDGRVEEMVTLISPYPDARLERLVEGTLIIVLRIRRPEAGGSEARGDLTRSDSWPPASGLPEIRPL
jgi:hypothetical protein